MENFATMLMYDAIDLSMVSPEAEQKVNEVEKAAIIVKFPNHRRHTVQERRKWNAKAKNYVRPECGLWPVQIREMQALKRPGANNLIEYSEKDVNHERHVWRAYSNWSREEARRERHLRNIFKNAMDEFELERMESQETTDALEDLNEGFVFTGETLSTYESLEVFETKVDSDEFADWREMDELIDNGEMYFTSQGGLYIASPKAFKFVCEHQDAVLSLIS